MSDNGMMKKRLANLIAKVRRGADEKTSRRTSIYTFSTV
jgi:hypothetical protein